jgi:type I restriction-modification system DNA methylase subunit
METTKKYKCDCGYVAKQKSEFDRHTQSKNGCKLFIEKHQNVKEEVIVEKEIEDTMIKKKESLDSKQANDFKILDNMHMQFQNILRDNESLVNVKALDVICDLLFIRLIQPKIKDGKTDENYGEFDLMNKKYYDKNISDDLIQCCLWKKIMEIKQDEIIPKMKKFYNEILWVHPLTCDIFKDKIPPIKSQETYKKLFDVINKVNFEDIDLDIKGTIYEKIISLPSKQELGQFFTNRLIIKTVINMINPQIFPNGSTEIINDPACGTGGFLIESYKYFKKQSKSLNIQLDYDYVSNTSLNGTECECDALKLAKLNSIMTTGNIIQHLELGNSLRNISDKRYDIIMTNPPFGIKGYDYNGICGYNKKNKDIYEKDKIPEDIKLIRDCFRFRTNKSEPLFVQLVIYLLKDTGRAGIILPAGEFIFGKSGEFINIRKYLAESCNITEVLMLPSASFKNSKTGVETLIIFFEKGKQTEKILFNNMDNDEKKLVISVKFEELIKNNYSLNYKDYIEHDKMVFSNDDIKMMKLGDICTFLQGIKRKSKNGLLHGKYPFYYCSIHNHLYLDSFDFDNEAITINTTNGSGKSNIFYINGKYSIAESTMHFNSNKSNTKYIYYYLKKNIKILENEYTGTNQKSITKDKLLNIEIPVPPLELQQDIVDKLDTLYEIKDENNKQIKLMEERKKIFMDMIPYRYTCDDKKLGDVCDVDYGTRIVKKNTIAGEYPVYGSGRETFTTNTYNRNGFNILIGRFALSEKCVRLVNHKLFLNDSGLTIKPTNDNINHKYLGYYTYDIQNIIHSTCIRGAGQQNLDILKFSNFIIKLPSIEDQQEIVKRMESYDTMINMLKDDINNLENEIKEVLNVMLFANDSNVDKQPEVEEPNDEPTEEFNEDFEDVEKIKNTNILDDDEETNDETNDEFNQMLIELYQKVIEKYENESALTEIINELNGQMMLVITEGSDSKYSIEWNEWLVKKIVKLLKNKTKEEKKVINNCKKDISDIIEEIKETIDEED